MPMAPDSDPCAMPTSPPTCVLRTVGHCALCSEVVILVRGRLGAAGVADGQIPWVLHRRLMTDRTGRQRGQAPQRPCKASRIAHAEEARGPPRRHHPVAVAASAQREGARLRG